MRSFLGAGSERGLQLGAGEAGSVSPGAAMAEEAEGEAGSGSGDTWVEGLREACEPEQHWRHRREFLLRNAEGLALPLEDAELRRLLSFSMVWANHVFLGCRYPPQVMEKVMDMAAGITVTNAPTHTLRDELVAKVKRGISSSNEGTEEPCKKKAVVKNKVSEDSESDAKSAEADMPMETDSVAVKNPGKEMAKTPEKALPSAVVQKEAPVTSSTVTQKGGPVASSTVAQKGAPVTSSAVAQKGAHAAPSAVGQKGAPVASSTNVKMDPRLANYDSTTTTRHKSARAALLGPESKMNYSLTKPSESKSENALPPEKIVSLEGAAVSASKSSSHTSAVPAKVLRKLTSDDAKERQPFFNRLYKAVAWKLVAVGGFSPSVNHVELLNSSIQSVKATLDVDFVPLKELADLPQNKSSQESVVCELRCKSVYLGTGCGKSKENAKAVASREALKLFLKKKVIVKLCKRKYKGKEMEDLVLLDEESKPLNLPPALRNPQEILYNNETVTVDTSK